MNRNIWLVFTVLVMGLLGFTSTSHAVDCYFDGFTTGCDGDCVNIYFGHDAEGSCEPGHAVSVSRRPSLGGSLTRLTDDASSPFTDCPPSGYCYDYRFVLSCPGCSASESYWVYNVCCAE